MQLGPFQIRPRIIVLSRGAYWRLFAGAWAGGFFLCRLLERSASPHVREAVTAVMAIVVLVAGISDMIRPQPRFIDHDKDQAALIGRFSEFLDRHHLWSHFLAEDPHRASADNPEEGDNATFNPSIAVVSAVAALHFEFTSSSGRS